MPYSMWGIIMAWTRVMIVILVRERSRYILIVELTIFADS